MFFTPGRILGLIAFIIVMFAVGALLKMLDARIGTPTSALEAAAEQEGAAFEPAKAHKARSKASTKRSRHPRHR